jgi:outer membrane protein TolC
MRLKPATVLSFASVASVLLTGCQSPLRPNDGTADDGTRLAPAVTSALEREIARLDGQPLPVPPDPGGSSLEQTLAPRRAELDAIGPQWSKGFASLDLGPTLDGAPRPEVQLTLKTIIQRAVSNNLSVQAAQLDQGISDARLARAEAAFDGVLFANSRFNRTTRETIGTVLGSGLVVAPLVDNRGWAFETGLQKPLVTGGTFDVRTSMDYAKNWPEGAYSPDPAWSTAVSLGLTQPLLRGFGTDVNMAQIRLARNEDRAAFERLRARLLRVAADAEQAYWRLAFARQSLVTANWLVEVGIEVRDVLARRREFDATVAQYANAVATVEQRKASVLTAQREVNQANNALKALINDPDLPVGGEAAIIPVDIPTDAILAQELRGAIITAAEQSPEVAEALLGIDSASIGVTVADNNRLPQLDLEGRLAWFGLDGSFGDSYQDIGSGDFVEYLVGARFSQAIGNRAAEATFREARLARSRSVIGYRQAMQRTVLEVKDSLQTVLTNYQLIRQNRLFRTAQAENLRALLVSERTLAALTPEFLQLKFQLQDTLGRAELQVANSLAEYNVAIAELYRAMGTGLTMNKIEIEVVDPSATIVEGTAAPKTASR